MSDDFDPDAYLREKLKSTAAPAAAPGDFDPDKYLREKMQAAAQPPPPRVAPPKPSLDATGTGLVHFARHVSSGLGDKIIAGEEALRDRLHDKTGKVTLSDAYARNLQNLDSVMEESDKQHETAKWVGNGFGVLTNALVTAGVGAAGNGARVAAQAAAGEAAKQLTKGQVLNLAMQEGAKMGGAMGAAGGFGASRAEDATGTLKDTGKGLAAGAAMGGALPLALAGGGALVRPLINGLVKRTPAASLLRRLGVQNLTVGQQAPESKVAQLEEASQSLPLVGPAIKAQRDAARESWQDVVLQQGRAPGAAGPLPAGDLNEKMGTIYAGFEPAYSAVKSHMVHPAGVAAAEGAAPEVMPLALALRTATKDPNVLATPAEAKAVEDFLAQQAGLVERQQAAGLPPGTLGPHGPVPASVMMGARENIRGKLAERLLKQDFDKARMLENAEQAVTGGLEAQLPDEAAAALRNTDTQYAKYKLLEAAAAKAKDNPGGTLAPQHLSNALAANTEKGAYARGGGGVLRELAKAGHEVLDARSPTTGHRNLTLPGLTKYAAIPAMSLINRPSVQPFMFGEAPLQMMAQGLEQKLRQAGLIEALRRGVTSTTAPALGSALAGSEK